MVFTGTKDYTTKKLRGLHGRGWVIVRSYAHANGKFTYFMEYKGKH